VPRVTIVCAPSCTGVTFDALLDELRSLGWVEGTTIVLDRKESGSRLDQLTLGADLVRSKPDLIVNGC
jgi:putative tryptophan/tyrosine transport system substrate-binding protein